MINIFSIRFRIAAWYFCSAAPILVVLAVGSWFAMRASMYQGIDEELFRRTLGVEQFFKTRGDNAIPELQRELTNGPELPLGGGLFQVFDGEGRLIHEPTREFIRKHLLALAQWTRLLKDGRKAQA